MIWIRLTRADDRLRTQNPIKSKLSRQSDIPVRTNIDIAPDMGPGFGWHVSGSKGSASDAQSKRHVFACLLNVEILHARSQNNSRGCVNWFASVVARCLTCALPCRIMCMHLACRVPLDGAPSSAAQLFSSAFSPVIASMMQPQNSRSEISHCVSLSVIPDSSRRCHYHDSSCLS